MIRSIINDNAKRQTHVASAMWRSLVNQGGAADGGNLSP
jgi:hypothetical protein